jgi:hypothetical protein
VGAVVPEFSLKVIIRGITMKRHYFVSESLDDLEHIENELEAAGVTTPQIHVLSDDDMGVEEHHLHNVEAVLKKDVVHGTEKGAIVGVVAGAAILVFAGFSGLTETYTWVPAIFLAVIAVGFCTWEGGLIGIQEPHSEFQKFQPLLREGKHILFVDVAIAQEQVLDSVTANHPLLRKAGEGSATPGWVIGAQQKWAKFVQVAP